MMVAIKRSRASQIELKQKKKDEVTAQDKRFAAQWNIQQKAVDLEERTEDMRIKSINKKYADFLATQAEETR